MSGSQTQQGGAKPEAAGADPSMEDILASIRRILSEEDVPASTGSSQAAEQSAEQEQDVLLLDSSMLVAEVPTPRPAIRARAVPPPPPPVLVVPDEEPSDPVPVAAKHDARSVLEPAQPEAKQVEAEEPEADLAESILVEITTEQLMAGSGIAAAVEQTVIAELSGSPPEAETRPEAAEFAPVKTEAPMPAEAIPPLTPATGLQASPVLVPVPRGGAASVSDRASIPREPPVSPPSPPTIETRTTPPEPSTTPQSESSVMSASMSSTGLASAETANAAAGSVTNLVRALTSDRSSQVFGGGPTIADLVREELRPMLKAWLDSNLPPLVERLVRAEIERVISRATV